MICTFEFDLSSLGVQPGGGGGGGGGVGDSHMKWTEMLVGNFEFNP